MYNYERHRMAKLTAETVFIENSKHADSAIKQFYMNYREANCIPYKCDCCGISSWNNKPLVLTIEHKNGNHFDNRIPNLELLCSNCHSQTDTFCGKNKWSNVSDDRLITAITNSGNATGALYYAKLNKKRSDFYARVYYLVMSGAASFSKSTYDIIFPSDIV